VSLLGEFRALDNVLYPLLLFPSLAIVAPPHRPLVFAAQSEMSASFAPRFSLITLLSPQSASEAACAAKLANLVSHA